MIALPGTTSPLRLEENWASRDIDLTKEEIEEMRVKIGTLKAQGDRYSKEAAKDIGN
jgi:diketogulonate reductase-like aldo/keto reductase